MRRDPQGNEESVALRSRVDLMALSNNCDDQLFSTTMQVDACP
jgi:hypothetical protein